MNNRHTLTKSLHTVTAVSRLAAHLVHNTGGSYTAESATRAALAILGQPNNWNAADPTMAACIAATSKLGV